MKANYLARNRQNQSLVWNGDDWRRSKTEPEHRAQAKLIRGINCPAKPDGHALPFPGADD